MSARPESGSAFIFMFSPSSFQRRAVSLPKSAEMRDTSSPRSFSLYFCRALVALLHLGGTTKRGSVSRRTLIGFGAPSEYDLGKHRRRNRRGWQESAGCTKPRYTQATTISRRTGG